MAWFLLSAVNTDHPIDSLCYARVFKYLYIVLQLNAVVMDANYRKSALLSAKENIVIPKDIQSSTFAS